jgi:hypothetical protein
VKLSCWKYPYFLASVVSWWKKGFSILFMCQCKFTVWWKNIRPVIPAHLQHTRAIFVHFVMALVE